MTIFTALLLLFANLSFAAGSPVQITSNSANQGRPDIQDNVIVWKDLRAGNWDIYSYNLATNQEQVISQTGAYQNVPTTNGTMIIWQDDRGGNQDIYMKTAFLGIEMPLVTGPGNQGMPAVSGNTVAYVDDSAGNNNIYRIDLVSREILPVCVNAGNQWQPRISGNRIVWEDDRNGNWDIFMKDTGTGAETQLSTDPGDDRVADVGGDIAVWQNVTGTLADIKMKTLPDGPVTAVTADAAWQNSPRISGDLVVWEDYRAGNWDIYMRDLTSNAESPLASGASISARPAIDREAVAYEDNVSGNYDVWMAVVPDVTPPVIANAKPEAGTDSGCLSPLITASYTDNRAGIDAASTVLALDGQDVTASAAITESSVSYQAEALSEGQHTVSLTVADLSGNITQTGWQFSASPPALTLRSHAAYWANYSDYEKRLLSVRYEIANVSPGHAADNMQIQASSATAGVILSSEVPITLGDVAAGGSASFILVYLVPQSTQSFKTMVYASAVDPCGNTDYIPGPPPGQ